MIEEYVDLALRYFRLSRELFADKHDDDLARYFSALLRELDDRAGELSCPDIRFVSETITISMKKYGKPPRVRKLVDLLLDDREYRFIMEVW